MLLSDKARFLYACNFALLIKVYTVRSFFIEWKAGCKLDGGKMESYKAAEKWFSLTKGENTFFSNGL